MDEPVLMSQSEYAARAGVSQPRISKLVSRGIIPKSALRRVDGRWLIVAELADAALLANLDPSRARKALGGPAAGSAGKARETEEPPRPVSRRPEPVSDDTETDKPPLTFEQARTLREGIRAELDRLKLDEARGNLVRRDDVERSAFECGRALRDAVLAVPDRVAAIVAAESDEHRVHEVIRAELMAALSGLSDGEKPDYVNFSKVEP